MQGYFQERSRGGLAGSRMYQGPCSVPGFQALTYCESRLVIPTPYDRFERYEAPFLRSGCPGPATGPHNSGWRGTRRSSPARGQGFENWGQAPPTANGTHSFLPPAAPWDYRRRTGSGRGRTARWSATGAEAVCLFGKSQVVGADPMLKMTGQTGLLHLERDRLRVGVGDQYSSLAQGGQGLQKLDPRGCRAMRWTTSRLSCAMSRSSSRLQ